MMLLVLFNKEQLIAKYLQEFAGSDRVVIDVSNQLVNSLLFLIHRVWTGQLKLLVLVESLGSKLLGHKDLVELEFVAELAHLDVVNV